jgi:hypothetical protein
MANIYDVPGIEGLVDSSDTTMANLRKVAFGSGLHEQAMRDYLNPFSRNKDVQIGKGAVGEYMSNFLKDYIDPNNQAGGKFGEKGRSPNQMQVVGLGESPNPFTASGIARAAEMAEDPSFQAENVFGEGTLTKVPGGYDYTGGKFDFNFAGPLEQTLFAPSNYGMKFDRDMNVLNQFNRDFRAFDQAKMGQTQNQGIAKEDDLMNYDEFYEMPEEEEKKNLLEKILEFAPFIGDKSLTGILTNALGGAKNKLTGFRDAIGTRLGPSPYGTSQAAFNALTPSQQQSVGSIYGQGGIMQGYNPVSAFGRGPIGSIQNRIADILGRKAAQTAASRQKLADLKNALTDLGGDSDAGYSPGQDAGMGFGGGRSDPTDKS